jgi:hypothetical protein
MPFKVRGPRASEFVELLSRYCGLSLTLAGENVNENLDGLINPSVSKTLRDLVWEILRSPNVVEIVAFGGNRDPSAGFWVDNFRSAPAHRVPRRSVFLGDFEILQKLSPDFARAMMGHVLREYFGAARPPGVQASQVFLENHIAALRTEAQIMGDLRGLSIWTGTIRPCEADYGNINVRSYGPAMRIQVFFNASGFVTAVRGP